MITTPTLTQLYDAHHGKVSDKWSSYLTLYEDELNRIRPNVRSMLEIGVQNGGSLDIWARYFATADHVVGCDINPACAKLSYDDPRVTVIVGDATQPHTRDQLASITPSFDLIIEDGSHIPREVILAFLRYWPMLNPGGVFIAEDLHCDYFATHEGGIARRDIANRFFSELVHLINLEHWQGTLSISHLLRDFATAELIDSSGLVGTIASVSFHNSIAIIRKARAPSDVSLGTRIIVGDDAIADPAVLSVRASGGDSLSSMRNGSAGTAQAKPLKPPTSFANLFGKT
jgi:hypothetical protein